MLCNLIPCVPEEAGGILNFEQHKACAYIFCDTLQLLHFVVSYDAFTGLVLENYAELAVL